MRKVKRYGRCCVDCGVRSKDVRTRDVPEYVKSTHTNKSGYSFDKTSHRAQVCDVHAEERWSEWKTPAS